MPPLTQANMQDRVAALEQIIYGGPPPQIAGSSAGGIQPPVLYPADGIISVANQTAFLTKGSAGAYSLAAPVAGAQSAGGDDGKIIDITSETAFAHVITCPDGFNAKGSSGTATFTAVKGNGLSLVAQNGHWWTIGGLAGVTLA